MLVPACSSSSTTPPPADSGTLDTGKAKDSGGGGCTGIDAAEMMITFSQACGDCVKKDCCMQAQACADDENCIHVVQCQLACIADGGSGANCAETCIMAMPKGGSNAEPFDLCLQSNCSSSCINAK